MELPPQEEPETVTIREQVSIFPRQSKNVIPVVNLGQESVETKIKRIYAAYRERPELLTMFDCDYSIFPLFQYSAIFFPVLHTFLQKKKNVFFLIVHFFRVKLNRSNHIRFLRAGELAASHSSTSSYL
jgi:hypothetical protein